MNDTLIAVDLAKDIFEIAVSHRPGKVAECYRPRRAKLLAFFAQRPKATVIMEACGSAHHWARKIQQLGHDVVLLPPHLVKPYVRRNKTDRADAKGLLEAYRNEQIRPVPVKSVQQQTLTMLHRLRSGWMAAKVARMNTLRGLLRELGLFIPKGAKNVVPHVWVFIEDADSGVPDALRSTFAEACREIRDIEERIKGTERQLEALAGQMPTVQQLRTVPGVGLLTATALVGFIGDARRFPSGRHFASYLGITPREFSSGSRRHLGRISKMGDVYVRMLLIHGARSVLMHAKKMGQLDRLRQWALDVEKRTNHNKAATALANKLARIVWAVWKDHRTFQVIPVAA
jgi:transposase